MGALGVRASVGVQPSLSLPPEIAPPHPLKENTSDRYSMALCRRARERERARTWRRISWGRSAGGSERRVRDVGKQAGISCVCVDAYMCMYM